MGMPVVKSTNGFGLPVSFVDQGGLAVEEAENGFGTPIIEVATGGLPATRVGLVESAFGPLKTKMDAGQDAVLFVNGDSTSYSEYGPYYKFAVALGDLHDYTVVLYRWAEWEVSAATGPKQYSAPVTLRTGTRGTLTMYLAALPGQVAGRMFEATRKPAAIDAIPKPDVAILHQGHNMQSFETPNNELSQGRGLFWSVIGLTSWQWQGVAQAITTQNPWRDNTDYTKVYNAIMGVAGAFPSLTLVDTHQLFIAAGKSAALYRDNIHPSDTQANSAGAQMIADALMSSYARAKRSPFSTVSWFELPLGTNLFVNGDLSNWTGTVPVNFQNVAGNITEKDTDPTNIFPGTGASWSAKLSPAAANGHFSKFQNGFDATERASMAGKTVTAIMLVKANPLQRVPYNSFVTVSGGATRTFTGGGLMWGSASGVGGWMPIVNAGIPCDTPNNDANSAHGISPAFGATAPPTTDPMWLQRCVIVEGLVPRLGLVRPA